MSSARNHAKRSHRSEHFKKSNIGAGIRKIQIKEAQKPQRQNFFEKFKNLFRRNNNND